MIKFKYAFGAFVLSVGTLVSLSTSVNAASCTSKPIYHYKTVDVSARQWVRNSLTAGVNYGFGNVNGTFELYYADCGDKHTKVAPEWGVMCLNGVDATNDSYFQDISVSVMGFDSTAAFNGHKYLSDTLVNSYEYNYRCVTYQFTDKLNPNGSLYWYLLSDGPRFEVNFRPNSDPLSSSISLGGSIQASYKPKTDPYWTIR